MSKANEVAQQIAQRIIDALASSDGITWQRPWAGVVGAPTNAVTQRPYTGGNRFNLTWASKHRHWATYKQWQSVGAQVVKGSKAHFVLTPRLVKDKDKDEQRLVGFGAAAVFHSGQVTGWEAPAVGTETNVDPFNAIDQIVQRHGVDLRHGIDAGAYYHPVDDYIHMPSKGSFLDVAGDTAQQHYYGTLAHELIHWTGHAKRLDRLPDTRDTDSYAFEELVAELGQAIVCQDLGLKQDVTSNEVAYVRSWLGNLRNDPSYILKAATQAEKAAKHLMG